MEVPSIAISNNVKIPQIGFGTWLNKNKKECKNAVSIALETGYRHFDTAQIYKNEQFIGEAIIESAVPRRDLFITTKIWNGNMFWDDIIPSLEGSLKKLKTDYVDLLLLHFPVTDLRRPAWSRMEDILSSGMSRSIGVSNYTIKHLEELLRECKVKPAVNQVELHVFLQQPDLINYCQNKGITLEAYSPLAHGHGIDNEVLVAIGKKHNKSSTQVMIRWCIEKGLIPLPKSTHAEFIKSNFHVFDFSLDQNDLKQIENLESDLRTCWDPTHVA